MAEKERVIAYIDGFNLYFGMLEGGHDNMKWLDVKKLVENLLQSNQQLVKVKYFTSRVSNNPDKQKRQTTYIEALQSVGVDVYFGQYQRDKIECSRCLHNWVSYNEKMTDVNIATQLMMDAFKDEYDMAMLISGDSDLVPPMKAIHDEFKSKRVFVAFPPSRHNETVKINAKGSMMIGRKKLADSQLDASLQSKTGYTLTKPSKWT